MQTWTQVNKANRLPNGFNELLLPFYMDMYAFAVMAVDTLDVGYTINPVAGLNVGGGDSVHEGREYSAALYPLARWLFVAHVALSRQSE